MFVHVAKKIIKYYFLFSFFFFTQNCNGLFDGIVSSKCLQKRALYYNLSHDNVSL